MASENIFNRLDINKDEHKILKFNHTVIASSSGFDIFKNKDEMFIYNGLSYFKNTDSCEFRSSDYDSIREELKAADGFFILASVTRDRVSWCRSLYRNNDIYYWHEGKDFIISTDIRVITSYKKNNLVDKVFLSLFLNSSPAANHMSPIDSVKKLDGGCELVFKNDKFKVGNFVSVTDITSDYISTISSLLKGISKKRRIYLQFSGGLDSTLIFLILKDAGIDFTALHHDTCSFEKDSEREQASLFCKKYGIDLEIISPSLSLSDHKCNVSHPLDCSMLSLSFESERFSYDELDADRSIVLDGQGGDSLFVQYPSHKVAFDLIKKGKCISAYSKLSDLSLLKNLKLPDLMLKNTLSLFGKLPPTVSVNARHSFSKHLDTRSCLYDYYTDVINMMETRPAEGVLNYASFSPILSLSSVRTFMTHDYAKNFSDEYDRLRIRNMLYTRFSEPSVFEKRKKSSVNMLFQSLKLQHDYLMRIIEDTDFSDISGLGRQDLRESLIYNSSVRLTEDAYQLLRVASAYQYYNSLDLI